MPRDEGFWPLEVSIGEVTYAPGGKLGPRMQPNIQFVLIHTGSARIWIDDLPRHVAANSVCVLLPGHKESFVFDEIYETHHTWVHIYSDKFPPALLQRLERLDWPLQLSPVMSQLMYEALALQVMPFPTVQETLKALALQMLWRYIGEGEQRSSHAAVPYSPVVERCMHFINTHLDEPLTLKDLAEHAAISPPHLIRLFRVHLGTTPMNYVWKQRVRRGIEMLEQTGLPVGIIAERCGFQSRYHFSRKIRQEVGYAPLEVRQHSWQHTQHIHDHNHGTVSNV